MRLPLLAVLLVACPKSPITPDDVVQLRESLAQCRDAVADFGDQCAGLDEGLTRIEKKLDEEPTTTTVPATPTGKDARIAELERQLADRDRTITALNTEVTGLKAAVQDEKRASQALASRLAGAHAALGTALEYLSEMTGGTWREKRGGAQSSIEEARGHTAPR